MRTSNRKTRAYNPPVNSFRNKKSADYRELRLVLESLDLAQFSEHRRSLCTAKTGGDPLKKSPK